MYPIASTTSYKITKEVCADGATKFVLRHDGEYVGESAFYRSMVTRAVGHKAAASGALTL